ncbi:MAG: hypothetical protein ACREDI_08810 [Roseiarcus sp.]
MAKSLANHLTGDAAILAFAGRVMGDVMTISAARRNAGFYAR